MSANKTLKLLNSITSTTSASHRRRRSSAAVTAAASTFAPMFQSTVPPNFFPHCNQQQQQPNQSQPTNQNQQQHGHHHHHHHVHHHGHHHPHGGVNASANVTGYQQFLPVFVTPTTPASSDLHTSYHGTNVTSPPPYYFHTPPISSNGGAGGAAIVGNGKNLNPNQQQQQQQAQQQQQPQGQIQQQQLFHPGTQAGAHGVNHSLHHTRTNSLHQDLLNKKHASRPSISQFSVANSSHFQFAFEAQPPSVHESVHHSPVQTSTNSNINNTTAVAPRTTSSKRSAHSRQSSLNQVQTVAQPQQQQRQQQQPVVDNSGFSFLCLNPEPVQTTTAPQPVVQNQLPTPTQGFLPGGFFSLTPEDSYPPLCTTFAQPATTPRENNLNSYFSIMPVNPVVQQIAPRNGYPTGYRRPTYQRLTKHAISAVDSKDSREFRWNRVLRYVHDISAPHGAKFPPSEAWILQQRQRVLLTPRHGSKGDSHSLWDGGSLGTNGVDDFIWDDDIQNGKRFTIPPKSQQGEDAPCEEDNMVFTLEPSKADFDLAFGYEVDDTNFCPPAKRTKSNESQKAARRGLHEYLAALKSFELSHVQDMKREAPLTMA